MKLVTLHEQHDGADHECARRRELHADQHRAQASERIAGAMHVRCSSAARPRRHERRVEPRRNHHAAQRADQEDEQPRIGPRNFERHRPRRGEQIGERNDRGECNRKREHDEDGPIPNPLQQTFDKRALKEQRPRREHDDENGPIPNPLQQTFDKRFVQKPRGNKTGGGAKKGGAAPRQPDPMQTSVGYIGADAFHRKGGRGGRRGR